MKIEMVKFGNLLNSRPAGREAALRVFQIVNGSLQKDSEEIITLDFSGVEILTPSFADEFITELVERYGKEKIKFDNLTNQTVQDSIKAISIL